MKTLNLSRISFVSFETASTGDKNTREHVMTYNKISRIILEFVSVHKSPLLPPM